MKKINLFCIFCILVYSGNSNSTSPNSNILDGDSSLTTPQSSSLDREEIGANSNNEQGSISPAFLFIHGSNATFIPTKLDFENTIYFNIFHPIISCFSLFLNCLGYEDA